MVHSMTYMHVLGFFIGDFLLVFNGDIETGSNSAPL